MTDRAEQIAAFLTHGPWHAASRKPLAGDASARRYERLALAGKMAVLMDADPAKGEGIGPFMRYTHHLRSLGLSAPEIYDADQERGLLIIEDLGDDLYARHLSAHPEDECMLYRVAIDVLVELHKHDAPESTADYRAEMVALARLAYDWYARGALGRTIDDTDFGAAMSACLTPLADSDAVLILRDFHAENLLWLPDRAGAQRCGLLDYQDAMIGPRAYDLVSLIKDARRDVSPNVAALCVQSYVQKTGRNKAQFAEEMAICSAQRNLRILGVFARLKLRDGKPGYIDYIPRVWAHLMDDLSHPALSTLRDIVLRDLPAPDANLLNRLRAA